MVKREKRLEKGIKSLGKQIELHKDKMEKAIKEGDRDLEGYYKKEIEGLKRTQEKKKALLDKQ